MRWGARHWFARCQLSIRLVYSNGVDFVRLHHRLMRNATSALLLPQGRGDSLDYRVLFYNNQSALVPADCIVKIDFDRYTESVDFMQKLLSSSAFKSLSRHALNSHQHPFHLLQRDAHRPRSSIQRPKTSNSLTPRHENVRKMVFLLSLTGAATVESVNRAPTAADTGRCPTKT
jgi:hypothetical protein